MRAGRPAAARAAVLLLLAGAPAAALRAQEVCEGHPIRQIRVFPSALFSIEQQPFSKLFEDLSAAVSWETHVDVVRRELRFSEGEPCDPRRLAESARVLRNEPYLRSATIVTAPAPGDSVDVEVTTRDEWALGGNLGIDTRGPHALKAARITEQNLLGRGMFAQLRYDYFGRRPGFALNFVDPQLIGRSDAELLAGRTSVGPVGELAMQSTFESEYDGFAWRAAIRWREEPFVYQSSAYGNVVQPIVSAGADLGLVWRRGPFGRQFLIGGSVAQERFYTADQVVASLPSDDSAAAAGLAGRFQERRRISLNLVAGVRNIRFVPHAGIDAVNAREDMPEGYEIRLVGGAAIGHAMGLQRDRFGLIDLYVGTPAGPRTLVFLRSRIEGRLLTDTHRWDNVIASSDLYTYTAVGSRGTVVLGLQAAGGWETSAPFQLLVAGPNALRGFGYEGFAAGRRVVLQAEHRYFLTTVMGSADVGSALFVDLGRGWAGDAAFGENTGTLVSVGAGIRVGFPSGSRNTTRLDVAVPVRGGHGAEVRFTMRQQLGITRRESSDVERSRIPVSAIALFNFSRY